MKQGVVIFIWETFGPYHMDRCEAAAKALEGSFDVYGLEIASNSEAYKWQHTGDGKLFRKITLFPNQSMGRAGRVKIYWRLLRLCLSLRGRFLFIAHYEHPSIMALAFTLKVLLRRLIVMQDSKFDDKQRWISKELIKVLFYIPYNAALVGSYRTKSYLQFLGLTKRNVCVGYDTVSLQRVCELAGVPGAPDGVPFMNRHFTIIARFVPKKNLHQAIAAYDLYCRMSEEPARELHLCGSGDLEQSLRDEVAKRDLKGVKFLGFLQEQGIAKTLASTLVLLLPSTEEQFGLVVNEALALGVPVILSDNCGARDLLVRSGVNGYIIEPDNPEGMARFMLRISQDQEEWRRLSIGTRHFAPLADTATFGKAVAEIIAKLQ